jgi:hypothetical protein
VTGMPAPIAACRAGFCPCPAVAACNRNTEYQRPNGSPRRMCLPVWVADQLYVPAYGTQSDKLISKHKSSHSYVHKCLPNYFYSNYQFKHAYIYQSSSSTVRNPSLCFTLYYTIHTTRTTHH